MEKGKQIKVLDHGYVQLIDSMGTDEGIIEAARMSTGRGFEGWEDGEVCEKCAITKMEWATTEDKDLCACAEHRWKTKSGDKNLLDFLWRNKHATPFEMCELQIEVQAPIMVFREWHRHRTQSYNEFSARYSVMPNLHYLPEAGRIQKQGKTNKQGSDESFPEDMAVAYRDELGREQQDVYSTYDSLIQAGVSKEVARVNTPVSRYSKMRAKTDLRNWLAFLNLRMRPKAQWEIRQYANAVAEIIKDLWPRTYALFEEYDLYSAHFSRSELADLKAALLPKGGVDLLHHDMTNASKIKEFAAKLDSGGKVIL